jgi:hypothetical protein
MPAVYQEADVFVLPSQQEGMSIALLEAMASGLPVIVTDTGGTAELVTQGENGEIVTWADVPALIRARCGHCDARGRPAHADGAESRRRRAVRVRLGRLWRRGISSCAKGMTLASSGRGRSLQCGCRVSVGAAADLNEGATGMKATAACLYSDQPVFRLGDLRRIRQHVSEAGRESGASGHRVSVIVPGRQGTTAE